MDPHAVRPTAASGQTSDGGGDGEKARRVLPDLARATSTRATQSSQARAVIVPSGGSCRRATTAGRRGIPTEDGGCPRAASDAPQGHDYESCIAIHAEANALLFLTGGA